MPKMIGRVKDLPPGTGGFIDPWCLAEQQNFGKPEPPSMEANAPPPPEIDPHSGVFYVWGEAEVLEEADGHFRMPVGRNPQGQLGVDLTACKLNHPPRLESAKSLEQGGWFPLAAIIGLKEALETGPPVVAAAPPPTEAPSQAVPDQTAPVGAEA